MTVLLGRRVRLLLLPTVLIWALSFAMLADNSHPTAAQPGQTQTGWLSLIYGDAPPGSNIPSQLEIHLMDDRGQTIARLAMADSIARPLYGKQVRVRGAFLDNGQAGTGSEPLFMVDDIAPLNPPVDAPENEISGSPNPASSGKIAGSQAWVNVLCKFSDVDAEPYSPSFFSTMFSTSFKGLDHYWRRTSYNQINLNGSTTTQWKTLPKPRSFYIQPGTYGANLNLLADDCTKAADTEVFFPDFIGVNLIFNDDLDCCAWGGGRTMQLDGQNRFYRVTWLPPWGQRHDIIAHEMGHGFGMPHSTGPANNPPIDFGVYVSDWDVMSAAGGMCRLWDDGRNHCLSQGTIAYHRDLAGWIPGTRIGVADAFTDTTFTLDRLLNPQTDDNKLMVRVPIDESPTHFYTIEVRDTNEYDQNVPTQAVIIHDVDTTRIGNAGHAYVVDADTNNNVNDAGAVWAVGETFYDAENNILVEILSAEDGSYTVHINNNASFISGVVMNETGDLTLEAATVDVINAATGQWEGYAETKADGSYSVTVPPGDHIVYAHAEGYALEYYDGGGENPGQAYYADALPLFVPASSTITNIDFHLNAGGTAVGVVHETGGSPMSNMLIGIEETLLFTCTQPDGSFTLSGIPLHTEFKIFSGGDNFCGGGQGFTRQWWENANTPEDATPIIIENAALPFAGLQFTLEKGGSLSGVVLAEEDSTGIEGAWVCAYDFDSSDFDQINPDTCVQTNPGGGYTLNYIPPGLKLVRAFADQRARLFYENAATYDDAELVLVTSGSSQFGLNFALPAAGTISGTVWDSDGETPMEGVTISTADNEYVGCSDVDGQYTLAVPPGTHIIMAGSGPCSSSSFPFLYYDDSLTLGGATPITIDAPGIEVVGIDFVRPAPTSNELLTNGGFEQGRAQNQEQAFGWKSRRLVNDKRVCDSAPVMMEHSPMMEAAGTLRGSSDLIEAAANVRAQAKARSKNGSCAFQFRANPGTNSSILQIVQPSSSAAGDTLILAAWVQGTDVGGVSIYANIHYKGGGGVQNMKLPTSLLNGKSYGYTFHSVQRILHGKVNKVHVVVRQNNGKGRLRVDDISLVLLPKTQQITTTREGTSGIIPVPDAPLDLRGSN